MSLRYIIVTALIILGLAIAGCAVPPPKPVTSETAMVRVKTNSWPDFTDDLEPESLIPAIDQSRAYLRRLPPDSIFRYGPDVYTAAHISASLDRFASLFQTLGPGPDLKKALLRDFALYQSAGENGRGEVLFTGYYEPELRGSLTRQDPFIWPIYARPDDLIDANLGEFSSELAGVQIRGRLEGRRLVPYYTRREIDREKTLAGQGLELAWVDDPVALFFLHIQGSGRLRLPDGQVVKIGYAASNGRPYRSLGRRMIEMGLLDRQEMSMPAIKDWLAAHPDRAIELLDYNESYVFFRFLENGPLGNINVPLTPGRSVALDHRLFPKGALAWIESRKPLVESGRVTKWLDFSRFVLVQDTGGAIKGPGRLDLFWGHGQEAEAAAGRMKEPGRVFFPVLKKGAPTG